MDELAVDQAEELFQLYIRFFKNLSRSRELSEAAIKFKTDEEPPELSPLGEDIIRAMIVLLHACVDDLLREMTRILYRRLPDDRLDKLPIRVGDTSAKSIRLATLARHPGKCLADVVKDSIDGWLSEKSFGNTGAVCDILDDLQINYEEQRKYLSGLNQLMDRRHRIVHNADLASPTDDEPQRITLDDSREIIGWFFDVDFFVSELAISILPPMLASPIEEQMQLRKNHKETWEKNRDDPTAAPNDP